MKVLAEYGLFDFNFLVTPFHFDLLLEGQLAHPGELEA
jgi:hypothetical protein